MSPGSLTATLVGTPGKLLPRRVGKLVAQATLQPPA